MRYASARDATRLRGDSVQLSRANQRLNRRYAFAITVSASKQVVTEGDSHATHGALGRRVIDLDGLCFSSNPVEFVRFTLLVAQFSHNPRN